MRRFLRSLIAEMTYADLAGRRRPRRYAVAAGLILLAAAGAAILALGQRARVMAVARATPAPVVLPARTPPPPPPPTPTPARSGEECPADPSAWTLEPLPGPENAASALRRIRPDCVYSGLARSVAADMLAGMGWTHPEIQEALRLPRYPFRFHPAITVTFEATLQATGRPYLVVPQEGLPAGALCPPGAEASRCPRFWMADEKGAYPFYYFVRGCFRPRHLEAGQVRDWGMPYPVICAVTWRRQPYFLVGAFGELRLRQPYLEEFRWNETHIFFGYDPALRMWLQIGTYGYPDREIRRDVWEYLRAMGRREAERTAGSHGQPVWDARWLREAFPDLPPKPPPPDWTGWPGDGRAFFAALGKALPESRLREEWSR